MEKGKVVSIEDRIPKLKQQRRRKANRRVILLLLMFFLLIACVVYFQSPLSHVRTVKVNGNEVYPKGELLKMIGISESTNIWKVDKKAIENKLKKLPEIKSANVKIKFPHTVIVNVKEYRRIAYIVKESSYLPVLENGKILTRGQTTQLPVSAPLLIGFSEGDVLKEMISSLQKLPEEVINSISEIHYKPKKTDSYRIILYMNDGFEVSATLRSFAEKMVHYPSIVSQLDPDKKGVIDLEVGSYFKAFDDKGAENVEEQ
ncbi:cell division protein FtsQ/DivIB [Bacillus methanolicus]|uniref:Cell division protein DivIB n=1 Tax=Bacillus methanolicus (strain MGA3 / ATCC 53907) TaxID=796606 RepID=I3DZ20_BACMM|nr:FtsQ-type POTRA domain-containing protein [Bacillus methanolicus]AIE59564.1 Cell division protein DivIB [Bacillus methanolicus MGA3]EIJ79491.1 cell division protein FtsQ [Bacillus methanolicus MGA3]UQD51622.1 cell division protein FtsQ [Bacillus methanolicus]